MVILLDPLTCDLWPAT